MLRHLPAYELVKNDIASHLANGVVVGLENNSSCGFILADETRASAIVNIINTIEEDGTQLLQASVDTDKYRLVKHTEQGKPVYIVPSSLSVKQCNSLFSDTVIANRIYTQSDSPDALKSLVRNPAYT